MITSTAKAFTRIFLFLFLSVITMLVMTQVGDDLAKVQEYLPLIIYISLLVLYGAVTICYRNITRSFLKSVIISFIAHILSLTAALCAISLYKSPAGSGMWEKLGYEIYFIMGAYVIGTILIIPLCFGIGYLLHKWGQKVPNKWLME